ncbi:MAG: F0F1 ATP synthase subunit delta [Candidatus Eisenbacteria bacterium]
MTAIPLAEAQAEAMKAKLETLTGRKVALVTKVDPKILAGAVVTIGGKILDGSVRHKLDRLRDELLASKVH